MRETSDRHPVPHARWLAASRYRTGPSPGYVILAGCLLLTVICTSVYATVVYRHQHALFASVPRTMSVVTDPLGPTGQPTEANGRCLLTLRASGLPGLLRQVTGPCYLTAGMQLHGWVTADRHVLWDRPPDFTQVVGRTLVGGVFAATVTFAVSGLLGLAALRVVQRRRYGS